LNALVGQYQVGPSMLGLYNNSGICPYDKVTGTWAKNFTQVSTDNAQLRAHLMSHGVGVLDFLSIGTAQVPYNENVTTWESIWENHPVNCTGNNNTVNCSEYCIAYCVDTGSANCTDNCITECAFNKTINGNGSGTVNCFENTTTNITRLQTITKYLDTLTYPDGVTYKVLKVQGEMFTVELRLNHLYMKPRSRKTVIGSPSDGVAKYEFYIGATFVTLQPYTSAVSVSTAQVSFEYFKSEFVFLSIATEQRQTPVDQLDIVIHQGKSVNDQKQYQYVEFDFSYDTALYPGTATVIPNSLRWVRNPTIEGVKDSNWNYPCTPSTGHYYTGNQLALDTLAAQTCLPQQPRFCRFDADKNFFFPFPTQNATANGGFLAGPDALNNLYIQFVLELTDISGFKHLSTVFFGVDLIAWPVLEHCQDTEFDYKDVGDALKITATVGIRGDNSSAAVLKQTISANDDVSGNAPNRQINEIVGHG
jgi:hypothetical protein